MQELIKVTTNTVGAQVVSARELYDYLEPKTKFPDWCIRMFEYGFEEGKDFISILGKSTGGRPSVDYALTLDTAKEIAMLQRTEKGKQARQYFIECEKRLNKSITQIPNFNNPAEAARAWANEYEQRQLAERKTENLQIGLDNLLSWVSILKVSIHNHVKETNFNWRVLKAKSHEVGYEVKRTESGRFEYQNLYHVDVFRVCYPQYNYDFKIREYN